MTGWSSRKLLRKVNPSISTKSNWPKQENIWLSSLHENSSKNVKQRKLHSSF